jgi:hypothetical protein
MPADERRGDHWDHGAYDTEHRPVLGVVPGKQTAANARLRAGNFQKRTGGRILDGIATDGYRPCRKGFGALVAGRRFRRVPTGRDVAPRSCRPCVVPDRMVDLLRRAITVGHPEDLFFSRGIDFQKDWGVFPTRRLFYYDLFPGLLHAGTVTRPVLLLDRSPDVLTLTIADRDFGIPLLDAHTDSFHFIPIQDFQAISR